MLENATRICEAKFGTSFREGDAFAGRDHGVRGPASGHWRQLVTLATSKFQSPARQTKGDPTFPTSWRAYIEVIRVALSNPAHERLPGRCSGAISIARS
jgi:hypothetical protein